MPATPLTKTSLQHPSTVVGAGVASDATNGNSYTNDTKTLLVLKNTGASTRAVVFTTPGDVGGNAIADLTISIAAGAEHFVKPLDPSIYGSTVTFTAAHAEVTARVVGW